uniref:Uncharacterized protein n=1 Tax=Schistosoma japonicum TaxID=6182 RepID=Q5C6R0_SCHJA|nr:unknown [Schistosoma japonicum]
MESEKSTFEASTLHPANFWCASDTDSLTTSISLAVIVSSTVSLIV